MNALLPGTVTTRVARPLLVLAAFAGLAACARAPAPPPAAAAGAAAAATFDATAEQALATVDAAFLAQRIREFSDDAFEGRGPATPGDAKARAWLVGQLQALGYEPGGPGGSWEQPFDVVGVESKLPAKWRFRAGGRELALDHHTQYIGTGGTQEARARIENAELVFVGYGIKAPEYQWDDFKGQDLRGKVLVMLNSDPDWDPQLFQGNTRLFYGRWVYKYLSAAEVGAAGAIIIHTTPSAGYPWQVVQTSWSGEQFSLPARGEPQLQLKGWVTEDAARQLAQLGGKDLAQLMEAAKSREFAPVPLGVRTSIAFTNTVARKQTANVAGLLRGSDPRLADEVVVFTAHHDHLGIGAPDATGDRIHNGALDNGAGVAQVLALAKAFKALPTPPRRSLLMLFVAAEEQGLLGSQYYAEHPTFAPGRIAANFNFDGGNIFGRATDLSLIGKGKSTLDAYIERYAGLQGRVVKPDQLPDRGFFYRSDQFNFARIGVPAYYTSRSMDYRDRPPGWGKEQVEDFEARRYHQPGDEFDESWTFEGMLEDIQLAFHASRDVANAERMPEWTPGDEFEAARKAALAQLPPL